MYILLEVNIKLIIYVFSQITLGVWNDTCCDHRKWLFFRYFLPLEKEKEEEKEEEVKREEK